VAVLFEKRFWTGIADGSITCTFRRWRRPQAAAGRRQRTAAGIVEVTAVDVVDPTAITEADARAAGYPSADAVRADLRGDADLPVTRVRFHIVDEPDPRAELAAAASLGDADRAAITARLDRLDARSAEGPWTRATLALIAARPAVRAGDLADAVGRERLAFKTDVRKLKALGLTESLPVGYRLSPRGHAYLGAEGGRAR
jgi:hypothetical protein